MKKRKNLSPAARRRALPSTWAAIGLAAVSTMAAASAATNTYQGGATGTWNSAANWSLGTIAAGTDDATFAGSTALTGVTLGANQSTNSLAITNTAGTTILNTGGFTLTLGAGGISKAVGTGALTIGSGVVVGSNQSWTNSSTTTGGVSLTSTLSGSGNLAMTTTANDAATFSFSGSGAAYTGNVSLSGGRITSTNANAFGSNAVTVNSGAQLYLGVGSSTNSIITGAGYGATAVNLSALRLDAATYTGQITVAGSATIGTNARAAIQNGLVTSTGAGNLTFIGAGGSVTLGNTGNNWAGTTAVNSGSTLILGASGVLPDSTDLTVSGALNANGKNETVSSLAGAGIVQNALAATASTLTVSGGTATFSGTLRDNAGTGGTIALAKSGAGVQTISGTANTFSGGTSVSGGKLQITNASGNALGTGAISVTGGTLGGTGFATAATTVNGGRLAPGTITAGSNFGSAGTLTLSGGLTLTSATLDFDLAATAAGASDKISILTGALTPTNVTFNFTGLSGVTTLETGVAYTLISSTNDLTSLNVSGITSTFNGALFGNYTATFLGTASGLQVTFTAVPEPSEFAIAIVGFLGFLVVIRRRRSTLS